MSYQITITNNTSKLQCNNTTDIRGVVIVQQDSVGGWQFDGFGNTNNVGKIRLRTAPMSYTRLTWERTVDNKIIWSSDYQGISGIAASLISL